MEKYSLDIDEAVIMKASAVNNKENNTVELILTNKNLIEITKISKLFHSCEESTEKYPLGLLKIYNNKANVIVEKNVAGEKQLELYFATYDKIYIFEKKHTAEKWSDEIIKVHKELLKAEYEKSRGSNDKGLLKSIKSALGVSLKGPALEKSQTVKMVKCPNCGAELKGAKGEEIQCSYCDAITIIK